MSQIQAVLTDIGGVVMRIHEDRTTRFLGEMAGVDPAEIMSLIAPTAQIVDEALKGQRSMQAVYEHSAESLRSAVSYPKFVEGWMAMLGEDYPGIREAYQAIPAKLPVYALSNTNDLHMEFLRGHWLYELSRGFYASNEIGMRKPRREVFLFVLEKMELDGEVVLYFDDLEENILAAGGVGIRGVHVTDPKLVPRTLEELGIIAHGIA